MMKVKQNFFLSNEAQENTWHAYLIQPYKEGYKNLKRSFAPTDQLRAKYLTSQELQSRLIGLKNLAHRIKFIGIGFALIFPLANVISQIVLKRIFNENVKSKSPSKETERKPTVESDHEQIISDSNCSSVAPPLLNPTSGSEDKEKELPLHIQIFNTGLAIHKDQPKVHLLRIFDGLIAKSVADVIKRNQNPVENLKESRATIRSEMEKNNSPPIKATENNPDDLKLFSPGFTNEEVLHMANDLKIQILSRLANPDRLFKEIQNECKEQEKEATPSYVMKLLKSKMESYHLFTSLGKSSKLYHVVKPQNPSIKAGKENPVDFKADSEPLKNPEYPQVLQADLQNQSSSILDCIIINKNPKTDQTECLIETNILQEEVFNRIIESIENNGPLSDFKSIWDEISLAIEVFVEPAKLQQKKDEVFNRLIDSIKKNGPLSDF